VWSTQERNDWFADGGADAAVGRNPQRAARQIGIAGVNSSRSAAFLVAARKEEACGYVGGSGSHRRSRT
jgi:hypothetical protein